MNDIFGYAMWSKKVDDIANAHNVKREDVLKSFVMFSYNHPEHNLRELFSWINYPQYINEVVKELES